MVVYRNDERKDPYIVIKCRRDSVKPIYIQGMLGVPFSPSIFVSTLKLSVTKLGFIPPDDHQGSLILIELKSFTVPTPLLSVQATVSDIEAELESASES